MKRLEHDLVLQSDLNVTTNRFAKRAIQDLHGVEPNNVMVINHHFDGMVPMRRQIPACRPAFAG